MRAHPSSRRTNIWVLAVVILLLLAFPVLSYAGLTGQEVHTVGFHEQPVGNAIVSSVVISKDTTLTSDLKAVNLTIDPGTTLTTDGYSILLTGALVNEGTIIAGNPSNGGTVLSTGTILDALNYAGSYGGSGGGAALGLQTLLSSLSGDTLALGGLNGILTDGGSGTAPAAPAIGNALIQSWYQSGMQNYLTGAGGAGGYSSISVYGGSGSYGIYIQANSITAGTIEATGQSSTEQATGLTAGGGGGGVIVLAYGSGGYIAGTYDVAGGQSNSNPNNTGLSGGAGGNGQIIVFAYGSTPPIGISLPLYPVTITESGLPAGTAWYASINGQVLSSATQSISFSETNGTFAYSVPSQTGYAAVPSSGTLTVQGQPVSVSVTFSAVTYPVTFTESGLPSGTEWFVNLTNGQSFSSTAATIQFGEPNGTYAYTVGSSSTRYIPLLPTGSFVIFGSGYSTSISWIASTGGSGQTPVYNVKFTESGLPSGTNWSVTLNGTTQFSVGSSITFQMPNGSYAYTVGAPTGYTPSPSSGTVLVNGGSAGTNVTFQPVTRGGGGQPQTYYAVTFTESGLPSGTNWSVTLNGTTSSSTSSEISFGETNGTYQYTVGNLQGYITSEYSGTVTVKGSGQSITINWKSGKAAAYPVTFVEFGLPAGLNWSVEMNGATLQSNTSSITFYEPNGTYFYLVDKSGGYTPMPEGGSIVVAGTGTGVSINWEPGSRSVYEIILIEKGLPSGTEWRVNLSGDLSFNSTNTAIVFLVPNGTYFYTITSGNSQYFALNHSGSFAVRGQPLTLHVVFDRNAGGKGIASQITYYGLLAGAILIAGSVGSVMLKRRLKG